MTQSEKITLGIAGVIIIIAVILVTFLFTSRSYDKEQSHQFKEIIAAKDSTLNLIQLQKEALLISIANSNKNIQAGKASAEISLNKVTANKPFYQDNTKKYESIPVIVNSLSNDSLQSAIEQWYSNR